MLVPPSIDNLPVTGDESNRSHPVIDDTDTLLGIGSAVEPTPTDPQEGDGESEVGMTLGPQIVDAVAACEAEGHEICRKLGVYRDVAKNVYKSFLDKVVCLHHLLNDEQRNEILRNRGMAITPIEDLTSRYLPLLQALFSDDPEERKRHKPKLTTWAQLGRGVVEGRGVKPETGRIAEYLSTKQGRKTGHGLAKAAYDNLPDVLARSEAAKDKKRALEAERNGQGGGQPNRPFNTEEVLKQFSAVADDLSLCTKRELAEIFFRPLGAFAKMGGLEVVAGNGELMPVGGCEIKETGDGCVIVLGPMKPAEVQEDNSALH